MYYYYYFVALLYRLLSDRLTLYNGYQVGWLDNVVSLNIAITFSSQVKKASHSIIVGLFLVAPTPLYIFLRSSYILGNTALWRSVLINF